MMNRMKYEDPMNSSNILKNVIMSTQIISKMNLKKTNQFDKNL